ncbi:uncharacterized protein GGS25DRAFT_521844 [Hypoxylon fragiforme]|uniref:uncharacterized protein n=1 Tax=Hypoxylon fragiforme TaxID=63214 RepID=UPI0020C641FF|nr:uncharacterized protein GGS25DRAFT_521844 [Hypoxylon fragiforme]KAI2608671.1 hypothetical protein GGS25DRAFT_521844 [Hypoxylon fragiforme]
MSLPSLETQAKVASDAAQVFVDHYYETRSRRRSLRGFYTSASPRLTGAGARPDISINGLPCADLSAYEALLEAQGAHVAYDVASFDAQPVNAHYRIGEPDAAEGGGGGGGGREASAAAAAVRNGDRISFVVQVSGTVRFGRGHVATADGGGGAAAASAAAAPPKPPVANVFSPSGTTSAAAAAAATDNNDGLQERPFMEAFVLVPHWEASARNAARGLRKWVIVSQNYRAL